MDIQTSKIELAKMILGIENPELISRIKRFVQTESKDFWLELTADEKAEIEFGLNQLENGERVSWEEH
jgi:hypothetical protein